MDYKAVVVVLMLLSYVNTANGFCPIGSKQVFTASGCHRCECCLSWSTSMITANCSDTGGTIRKLPHLPPYTNTLILPNFRGSLDRESFSKYRYLQDLTLINLNATSVHPHVFKNAPRLRGVNITISATMDVDFLCPLNRSLENLHLFCTPQGTLVHSLNATFCLHKLYLLRVHENCTKNINLTSGLPPNVNHFEYTGTPSQLELPSEITNLTTIAIVGADCARLGNVTGAPQQVDLSLQCKLDNVLDLQTRFLAQLQLFKSVSLSIEADTIQPNVIVFPDGVIISKLQIRIKKPTSAISIGEWWYTLLQSLGSIDELRLNGFGYVDAFSPFMFLVTPALRKLDLSNNYIKQLPGEAFMKLENLAELTCDSCVLTTVPVEMFQYMPRLSKLVLSNNHIRSLNITSLMQFAPNLTDLDLRYNAMYIPREYMHFKRHDKLQSLNLCFNIMDKYPTADFTQLSRLRILKLDAINVMDFPSFYTYLNNFKINGLQLRVLYFKFNSGTVYSMGKNPNVFQGVPLEDLRLNSNALYTLPVKRLELVLQSVSNTIKVLTLSYNRLTVVTTHMFKHMNRLVWLDLAYNELRTLPADLTFSMEPLGLLDLNYNQLETLTPLNNSYLVILKISQNIFVCNCQLRDFRNWVDKRRNVMLFDGDSEICLDGTAHVINFTLPWLQCDGHLEMVAGTTTGLVVFMILLLMVLIYRFRFDIVFWWFVRIQKRFQSGSYQEHWEMFDAFVSFSSADDDFVYDILRPTLEDEGVVRFRVAIHDRDFEVGDFIADNIVRIMDNSHMVIFVVSRPFLASEWCQYELRMAQAKCFREGRLAIILLFVEKISKEELPTMMRTMCRQVTQLSYPEGERAREIFWRRLKTCLMKSKNPVPLEMMS